MKNTNIIILLIIILMGLLIVSLNVRGEVGDVSVNVVPPSYCGDGTCDPGETCSNCIIDCGACLTGGGLPAPPTGKPPEEEEEEERLPLFDINIELITGEVIFGNNLAAKITLINFGRPGRVDVNLYYMLKNVTDDIVYNETEVVTVETQKEFIKNFDVSKLEDGEYLLLVKLEYEDQREPAETGRTFVISGGKIEKILSPNMIGIIIILLGSIIITLAWWKRK